VDAMGGDLGPSEVVAAVKLALADEATNPITLIGDQTVLGPLVEAAGLRGHPRVGIVHASEVITMEDKPLRAIAKKKDSSMVRGFNLIKEGKAAAFVSSGNTGALMAGSKLIVGSVSGVDRPVLAAVIPRENGHFILIDAGANPEAKAEHLVHNAILGADYARVILNLQNPRVGLLTIGTEEGKGTALTTEANNLLKKINGVIHYVGPIEGFQVFKDTVDVVVCDGFVGNTLLKTWESLAKFISGMLRDEIKRSPVRMAGGLLAKGAFDVLKARMNPDRYGGAPLLGVKGNVLKAHGSSNRHAWTSAIRAAAQIIHEDLYHRIESDVARANQLMATSPGAEPPTS
jgi:glycerol-3-phosphate acyltransferase PlsX